MEENDDKWSNLNSYDNDRQFDWVIFRDKNSIGRCPKDDFARLARAHNNPVVLMTLQNCTQMNAAVLWDILQNGQFKGQDFDYSTFGTPYEQIFK